VSDDAAMTHFAPADTVPRPRQPARLWWRWLGLALLFGGTAVLVSFYFLSARRSGNVADYELNAGVP
jgi:hypothetical protein